MGGRHGWMKGVILCALLLAGFALKGVLIAPPAAPAQVRPGEFDTGRAIARLQRILGDQRPHPVDTAADDSVRDRLLAELRAIGLQPEVRETPDCSALPKTRIVSCSLTRNVVATIPGRAPGRHLLLNAHYDSTPAGPGAADDGVGVAALLEVGAILKAAPPPRPVTLLFNEGEEYGLNGSAAFVRSAPLAKSVDSLINIDARGVTGPALMFETSEPNGAAIALYGRSASRPYANSISTDFARLIPNTTDVVQFKPMHWTLINYGIIGNETRYHSPGDTVEALDRSSLYHVGSEVLAATQRFAAEREPGSAGSGQAVFTDIAGRGFIQLPLIVAAVLLGLLVLGGALLAWREKAVGRALAAVAGTAVAGLAVAVIVGLLATLIRSGDFWRAYPLVTYLAVYAVLLAAMAAAWRHLDPHADKIRMRAAAWLLILIVGAALSLALPGATIFFLIAPAIALAGVAVGRRSHLAGSLLAAIAIIVQFVMFAQLLALIEMLLIDGPLWAVAPLAALAALPVLVESDGTRLRPAAVLLAVAAITLWAAALLVPRASAARPLSFSIDYFRDSDRNRASWGVASKEAPLPAPFPGRWAKGELPYNGRTRWLSPAPLAATPVPTARVIAAARAGNGRRIRIALSPGGGDAVAIRFDKAARLLAIGMPGMAVQIPADGEPAKATLRCSGRSCEGLVIEAILADRKPVTAELFATRFALPPQGAPLAAGRPANAIPQYSPDETVTLKRVKL